MNGLSLPPFTMFQATCVAILSLLCLYTLLDFVPSSIQDKEHPDRPQPFSTVIAFVICVVVSYVVVRLMVKLKNSHMSNKTKTPQAFAPQPEESMTNPGGSLDAPMVPEGGEDMS